jgi:opacity protein-like surface antigen
VSESFLYTPETPGFLAADPQAPVAGDAFFRGVQNFRANTFSNSTSVKASYPLARSLAVRGDYSFLTRRFGTVALGTTGGISFFDSTVHTYSAGPEFTLTPVDSIALLFRQALLFQDNTTGSGGTIETNTQSLSANYSRVMPNWRFELAGGAVLIEPVSEWFPTGAMRISSDPSQRTTVALELSRAAAPSFFLQPGAMISNVGQVLLSHHLSDRLTLRGNVGYAYNQLAIDTSVTYQNLNAGAGLDYKLTRTISASLFYNYTYINNGFALPEYQVSRNQVGFSLTTQWKDPGIKLGE